MYFFSLFILLKDILKDILKEIEAARKFLQFFSKSLQTDPPPQDPQL